MSTDFPALRSYRHMQGWHPATGSCRLHGSVTTRYSWNFTIHEKNHYETHLYSVPQAVPEQTPVHSWQIRRKRKQTHRCVRESAGTHEVGGLPSLHFLQYGWKKSNKSLKFVKNQRFSLSKKNTQNAEWSNKMIEPESLTLIFLQNDRRNDRNRMIDKSFLEKQGLHYDRSF